MIHKGALTGYAFSRVDGRCVGSVWKVVQSGLSGNRVVHQICLGCNSTLGYASNWGLRSITNGRLYSKGVGEDFICRRSAKSMGELEFF